MTQITTSGGMITFKDTATGLTKQIGQNRLWVAFKGDTVNFLRVDIPTDGYDGTPFFSVLASNLTINGQSYTIEELKNGEGLGDMFSSMSFNIEIVEELPNVGDPSTIYLIYDSETGSYTEYLWLAQEQVWEQLGSVAEVDLGNYYNKSQVDQLLAAKANTSSLSTVATSGSYNDLSDKPVIPTVPTNVSAFTNDAGYLTEHQSLANYYNKSQTDNLLNGKVSTGTLATVATSGSYNDLTNKPDLSTKQDVLVSGVNIKTINSQSLLGEGNINIEGGGGGTQVQSNWNETDTTSMAYIQNKPTNVSAFTNDAGYLTSHQSLADVFADVAYDSATKRINFYGKGDTQHTTALAYVDASDFVVDGMVEDVRIENGNLVIDFNTDSGITDISIPLTDIFDPDNYYTKKEVDDLTADFASTRDVESAVDGAKPYLYRIEDTTEKAFNDAVTAINAGQGIILTDGTENTGYPATYVYDELQNTIRFVYLEEKNGNAVVYDVTKTPSRGTKSAGPVTWTEENIDRSELYYYGIEDSDVNDFNDAYSAIESGKVLVIEDGVGGLCPAASVIDGNGTAINLSYVGTNGDTNAYEVTKQSSRAPLETITWTNVTPETPSIDVDSEWVQGSTNPVESQLIQTALDSKADSRALSDYATTTAMNTALAGKQDTLVSGTNIKTINNQSILGSGNITIEGGSQITVDSALSSTSTNPVENRAIYAVIGDIESALQTINGTTNA